MIAYEVTLFVQRGIEREFRAWLDDHVRAILALPGFTGAEVFEREDPAAADGEFVVCTVYRLRDADALQAYFRDHAAAMRADGVAHFGERFRAERRVLASLARY